MNQKEEEENIIECDYNNIPMEKNPFTNNSPLHIKEVNPLCYFIDNEGKWKKLFEKTKEYILIEKTGDNKYIYIKQNKPVLKINEENKLLMMDPSHDMYICDYRDPSQILTLIQQMPIKNMQLKNEFPYLSGTTIKNFCYTIFGNQSVSFCTKIDHEQVSNGVFIYTNVSTITIRIQTKDHLITLMRDGCSATSIQGKESKETGIVTSSTNATKYLMQTFGPVFTPSNEKNDMISTFKQYPLINTLIQKNQFNNQYFLIRPKKQVFALLSLDLIPGMISLKKFNKREDPYLKKKILIDLLNYVYGFFGWTFIIHSVSLTNFAPVTYKIKLELIVYFDDGTKNSYDKEVLLENNTNSNKNKNNIYDTCLKKCFVSALKKNCYFLGNLFMCAPRKLNTTITKYTPRLIKTIIFNEKNNSLNKTKFNSNVEKRNNEDLNNVDYQVEEYNKKINELPVSSTNNSSFNIPINSIPFVPSVPSVPFVSSSSSTNNSSFNIPINSSSSSSFNIPINSSSSSSTNIPLSVPSVSPVPSSINSSSSINNSSINNSSSSLSVPINNSSINNSVSSLPVSIHFSSGKNVSSSKENTLKKTFPSRKDIIQSFPNVAVKTAPSSKENTQKKRIFNNNEHNVNPQQNNNEHNVNPQQNNNIKRRNVSDNNKQNPTNEQNLTNEKK